MDNQGILSGTACPVSMHCDAQQRGGQNMGEVPAEPAENPVLYARLRPFGGRLSKLDLLQGKFSSRHLFPSLHRARTDHAVF